MVRLEGRIDLSGKQKPRYRKEHLGLRPDHGWRAKPGNQIVVLDRGAVRFDVPRGWVVGPETTPFTLLDKPQPDDNARIQVSVFHLPPGIDWTELPLDRLLRDGMGTPDGDETARTEPVLTQRPGLELAWAETRFIDPTERRDACSRICLARGADLQPLITLDFWQDDAGWAVPVWDELLRSLRLGQYVADPTQGPPVYH